MPKDTVSLSLSDYSAADAAMSCKDIVVEQGHNAKKINAANKAIEENRKSNETAAFVGGFFPPAYIATEGNYQEKDIVQAVYKRQNTLIELASLKHCHMQD